MLGPTKVRAALIITSAESTNNDEDTNEDEIGITNVDAQVLKNSAPHPNQGPDNSTTTGRPFKQGKSAATQKKRSTAHRIV